MTDVNEDSIVKKALTPFAIFVVLFLGAGFIPGSIVHLGEGINPWDIGLLFFGILFFTVGSYIQEVIYNKKNLKEGGIIRFLAYSLLLSLGIGMTSGGTQHFDDTPYYSAYLIPIGLSIGIIAFIFKQNINLTYKQWRVLLMSVLVLALAGHAVLRFSADFIHGRPSHTHSETEQH